MTYDTVIGLEIHAQLQTATKIFCGCSTAFGAAPNTHVCPICLGFPGVLPVLNRAAIDLGARAALALGCRVNSISIFARKNYFYPDLPKGYQISQYDQPLASGGLVEFTTPDGPRRVGITRVHLEEDAGKSLHEGFHDSDRKTYLDYNRAGVPLIEIVTEPDLRSPADAAEFFARLRAILVWLDVNDGNMEEGSLRCDANVSLRAAGTDALGTKEEKAGDKASYPLRGEAPESAKGRYSPGECIGCREALIEGDPDPKHSRRRTRLTNAFSKKAANR
jgi:aspartyl-tRNA(Asn)/glutamyl-tRNA(Gln) amidotransferase subunit B